MNERISVRCVASEQAVTGALKAAVGGFSRRPVTAEAARREPTDGAVDCAVYADHAGDADEGFYIVSTSARPTAGASNSPTPTPARASSSAASRLGKLVVSKRRLIAPSYS